MKPVLAQAQDEYGDKVDFIEYDITKERGKAKQYGITAVPTCIFLKENGEIANKVVGAQELPRMEDLLKGLIQQQS
jgi:thiol-disulfide isomerase/thioredoxin